MMNNSNKLMPLLLAMQRIRAVEQGIAERYGEWKMRCPTHLSIGQECVGAVLGLALSVDDFVVSSHRAHAHYLGKGGDIRRMLAEIYGKRDGCSAGKGGSMHLADPSVGFMGSTAIVANSIPIGVGLALSAKLQGSTQISCCCFGDGAVEEGCFYESANFAALKKLPVLFLCENNLYSVYSPLSVRQPKEREIYQLAAAIGVDSYRADGNDGAAVLTAVEQAATQVRRGEGPVFIEFDTYRWREHCGPNYDNDLGYRSQQEFANWQQRDPIKRLESMLVTSPSERADYEQSLAAISAEIEEAFAFAEQAPFPDIQSRNEHIYAEDLTP